MVTLVVIAPVRLYREGLAALFAEREGFDVLATARAIDDGVALVRETSPDVALVTLGVGAGPELVRALATSAPATRVVVLGIADDDPDVLPLAEAGVAGYVTTEASGDEVAFVVESVTRAEMPCSPRLAATLLSRVTSLATQQPKERSAVEPLDTLTTREREIVELINEGLSNKEIASGLSIEVTTVKNHVHHILEKLNVSRRSEAATVLRRRS